jgi:hypothetical protein
MIKKPALLLLSLPLAAGLAAQQPSPPADQSSQVQQDNQLTPGKILAAQISEIANTKDLPVRSKNRQIASAVRLAITTVTTNLKNTDDALNAVLDLVTNAAKAAPDFADVIREAALDAARHLPQLSDLAGLGGNVQDAIFAGVKAAATDSGRANFESGGGGGGGGAGGPSAGTQSANSGFGGRADDVIVSPSH